MSRPQPLQKTLPEFWRILQRFWPYMRKQRKLVAGSMLALFAEVGFRLLEPWPLKFVFDQVIPTGNAATPSGIAFLDSLNPGTLLVICALAVVAITALRAVAAYFNTVGFAILGNSVLTQVRSDVYNHIQRLPLSFHTKARSGDLVLRVIGDVSQLKDVAVTALLPMLANVLILVGMLALMMWLNWQLTLLTLVTVPLFWLTTARLSRRIQEAARLQRRREGAMAATAAESLNAIKIVQALSLEEKLAESFFSQNKKSLKQDVKASKLSASLERTVDVFIAVATGLVLWQGANLVMQGSLTAGDLLVFLTYLKNGFKPVRDFAKYTGRLAKATAAGERVLDVLEHESDVRNMPGAVPAPALQGAVRFSDVSFEYEPGHPVLQGINLDVRPGQHIAVVGASGNGKSTMLSLVLRLYDPTVGSVLVDGRDVREYTIESLRSQVSVVMQDTILFAASVRDNIAYGAPDATEEEIEAAARLANAHDFIEALPEGYDTVLGERGATLSNGQRQRISIARAAIRKAPILILDEPTTGLDEENERMVMDALDRLIVGRTAFLVTHKLSQARNADAILVLEGGHIVEQGTHWELMRAGGVYRRLYTGESLAGQSKELATPVAAQATAVMLPALTIPVGAGPDYDDNDDDAASPAPRKGDNMTLKPYKPASAAKSSGLSRWNLSRNLLLVLVALLVALGAAAISVNATPRETNSASLAAGSAADGIAPTQEPVPTAFASMERVLSANIIGGSIQSVTDITYSGWLTGVASLAWHPDNRTVALGSLDNVARLLDTATGKVSLLKGHTDDVYMLVWSPDGTRLATGGFDTTVRLWSADGQPLSTLPGNGSLIAGLAWFTGTNKLTSVSTNLTIQQWEDGVSSTVTEVKGSLDSTYNAAWSPDGKVLAAGLGDGTVRLWDQAGKPLNLLQGHTDQVYCIAWSPNGKTLATAGNDNTVRLWSAGGEPLAVLEGHTDFVDGASWSPDGKMLATGAFDHTVRLWGPGGESLGALQASAGVLSVAWSPDGKSLAAALVDNTVSLWKFR